MQSDYPSPIASQYRKEQIEQYLSFISFPRHLLNGTRNVDLLNKLHAIQIAKIPYDNLSLHYNPDHRNDLDPQVLFRKFVTNARGRGGYCMETAIFWREILRGLGFHTYTAAARIRMRYDGVPKGEFIGYVHVTNIVTVPEGRYSSDVGFGGDGETLPLPLSATQHPEFLNLGTQQIRLTHAPFASALEPSQNMFWHYQYRNTPEMDWATYYAFSEQESFDADFNIMNYYTSRALESFQVQQLLVVKFILSGEGLKLVGQEKEHMDESEKGTGANGLIAGKVMMAGGVVKRNLGGKTEVLLTCRTEDERVAALHTYFGIALTQEERREIQGWGTELRG